MEFHRYNSIENSYQGKYIGKIQMEVPSDEKWLVMEKIHGANFAFYTDGITVRCAKRSGFIPEGEDFYGHLELLNLYQDRILRLYDKMHIAGTLSLHGEIFGDGIQSGVFYSKQKRFLCYDAKHNGIDVGFGFFENMKDDWNKLTGDTLPQFFLDPVYSGLTLKEALEIPVEDVNSFIPAYYGEYARNPNFWEGVVIKPHNNHYIFGDNRVILKSKTLAFREKKNSTVKLPKEIPEHLAGILQSGYDYINRSRLDCVCSKEGLNLEDVEGKDIGKVIGLFTKDCVQDFIKDQDEFILLDKSDQKIITKELAGTAAKLFKKEKFGYV